MKFRGVMYEMLPIKEFANIVNTLSKFVKDVVMRITNDHVSFIVSDDETGPSRPCVWCEIPVDYYFREYLLEGVSETHNEIYLEYSCALLARAMKQTPRVLKLKLTNKATPCLSVEVDLSTDPMQSQQCVHDIPIRVIPRKLWDSFAPIDTSPYNLSVSLPSLKALKSIVERLKAMSHYVIISASQHGRLTFTVETNHGVVAAHFPDLEIVDVSESEDMNDVSARVDLKKFHSFLNTQQTNYSHVTCNIARDRLVMLYLEQPLVFSIKCYLSEISR